MDGSRWHADRKAAEALMVALSKATPEAMATLQTLELERVIVLLATAACGAERKAR